MEPFSRRKFLGGLAVSSAAALAGPPETAGRFSLVTPATPSSRAMSQQYEPASSGCRDSGAADHVSRERRLSAVGVNEWCD